VDDYDPSGGFWPESRVFSIASMPGDRNLQIVYSVKGRYTKLMESLLAVGRDVWLKLPYGDFTIEGILGPDQDAVLIAGGTGISPFLPYAMQRCAGKAEAGRVTLLFYGVRFLRHVLRPELWRRCSECGAVITKIFIEKEEPEGLETGGAAVHYGSLDIGGIIREAKALRDPAFFLSGPPAMIEAFHRELLRGDFLESRLHWDDWG
jgi:NAD(P)H-flavin reductase